MANQDPLVVYWSPDTLPDGTENGLEHEFGWNMMYPEPSSLFRDLTSRKNPQSKADSFFACPATSNRMKNTFIFKNNFKTEVTFDVTNPNEPVVQTDGIGANILRESALVGGASLNFFLRFMFFAEEPTTAIISPPYLHRPEHSTYGTSVPGYFDISKWFRPFCFEMQTFVEKGKFVIEDGDPLFYLEVATERPIILKRFVMTKELHGYAVACARAPKNYGANLPLSDRYKRFLETKTNKLVLKEIQQNLVDD